MGGIFARPGRMQEQHSGARGLSQLQLVFLELPKYAGTKEPRSLVEKWAYFFREAESLTAIPEALAHPPVLEALEAARTARFTAAEWDAYIRVGMAIQNERGALSLAHKEGEAKGLEQGSSRGSGWASKRCAAHSGSTCPPSVSGSFSRSTRPGSRRSWPGSGWSGAGLDGPQDRSAPGARRRTFPGRVTAR
jgi:hypothetical protein